MAEWLGTWTHNLQAAGERGFEPAIGRGVVSLSKTLYPHCILSTQEFQMGTGIIQCWEGNRLVEEEV